MASYDYLFKLLLLGDSAVGKSALLERFCDNVFNPTFMTTIGIDFKVKTVELDGKKYKLQIWDTAGQERFRTITTAYYRGAMGIIIMFDLNNRQSFHNVQSWIENINGNMRKSVPIILVGNKSDLPKQISDSEVNDFAKEVDMQYFETSAKSNINVNEVFLSMTRACVEHYVSNRLPQIDPNVVRLDDKNGGALNKNCCVIM